MRFSGQVELGTRNNLEYFRSVLFNPLNTGIFFNIFMEICLLATLRENGWLHFHEIFSKDCTWDKEQFLTFSGWDVAINPLNTGPIFLFSGLVIVVGEWIFMKFSWNVGDTEKIISYTVTRLASRFHGFPSRRSGASVSNIAAKWMNRFLWTFQDMSTMTQGTIWNIFVMERLNPWIQDSFFYFYMLVSRLNSLYHAPQTMRGGGLCSTWCSCPVCYACLW